jgi:hypothetical protein
MHRVRIEVQDTDTSSTKRKKEKKNSTKNQENVQQIIKDVHFFAGNPSIEITEGIMHLYRNEGEIDLNTSSRTTNTLPVSEFIDFINRTIVK